MHNDLLDPLEHRRATSYVGAGDRARFVVGTALLKSAVAHELGVDATEVHVDRTCMTCGAQHGPPRLIGSDLKVSVAHSGELVLAALTPAGPVGVDVEEHASRVLLPRPEAVVTATEPLRDIEDLFTYWCRKESVLKAMGIGLTVPLLDVVVSPAREPAGLLSYKGKPIESQMWDLDLGAGYTAAVTLLASEPTSVDIVRASSSKFTLPPSLAPPPAPVREVI